MDFCCFNAAAIEGPAAVSSASTQDHRVLPPSLPDEIVLQIFQAVSDILLKDVPWYEWWALPPEYTAFANAASLVDRHWHKLLASSVLRSTMSLSPDQLWQILYWRPPPPSAHFLNCKHLHVCSGPLLLPPTIRETLEKKVASDHLWSFSFDINCLDDPRLEASFIKAASRVTRLHLDGSRSSPWRHLQWEKALFLHGDSAVEELVLSKLRLRYEGDASRAIKSICKKIIFQDVILEKKTDIFLLFPVATHLVICHSDEAYGMIGPQALDFSNPSDTLRHLEVSWSGPIYPLCHIRSNADTSILASPNLRTLRLRLQKTGTQTPRPVLQAHAQSVVIPGYVMPKLEELVIHLPWTESQPSSFVEIYAQLEDPWFCPSLTRLPDFKIVTRDDQHRLPFLEDASINKERAMIRKALAALQARGLQVLGENVPAPV